MGTANEVWGVSSVRCVSCVSARLVYVFLRALKGGRLLILKNLFLTNLAAHVGGTCLFPVLA